MNKRQQKKNQKKYLPIIADEFNLMTMTAEERTLAEKNYMEYRERYAFRKKNIRILKMVSRCIITIPSDKSLEKI